MSRSFTAIAVVAAFSVLRRAVANIGISDTAVSVLDGTSGIPLARLMSAVPKRSHLGNGRHQECVSGVILQTSDKSEQANCFRSHWFNDRDSRRFAMHSLARLSTKRSDCEFLCSGMNRETEIMNERQLKPDVHQPCHRYPLGRADFSVEGRTWTRTARLKPWSWQHREEAN